MTIEYSINITEVSDIKKPQICNNDPTIAISEKYGSHLSTDSSC